MPKKKAKKKASPKALQPAKRQGSPVHGLYLDLNMRNIDYRTKLGKAVKGLKTQLRTFVGESTTASELLIQRITYKAIKLGLYELNCFMNLENKESDHYLPMANSLRLDLQALAGMAGKPKPPNLDEYLRRTYGNGIE
jgi:hypothetical protein